jgi:parallel beta-helix repeat protein
MNDRHPLITRRLLVATGCVVAGLATTPAPAQMAAPSRRRAREYDVRDFDAIGDGVADDTSSIRSAIAAASSAGGSTVLFPPGTYNVSSTIKVPGNLTLRGCGRSSRIHGSTDNLTILSLGDCRGTIVEALRFTGVGRLGMAGRGAVWLSPENGTGPIDCKIINNWFEGLGTCGIVVGFATNCLIAGNHIDGTAEHGIYVSSSNDCIVANNVVRDAGRRSGVSTVVGIKVARTNGLVLSANVVESPLTEGILIESGTSRCSIVGNLIRRPAQRAIRVNDKTSNIQINGNILSDAGTEAIRLFGGVGCNISGNTIDSNKDTAIAIDLAAKGALVSNNSIASGPANGWAIRLDGSSHVLMGNVISECRYGINIMSGARDLRIMFNRITATGRSISDFDPTLVKVVE